MDDITSDASVDELLQVIAVLIERLGGEVVIGHEEFTEFEDVPVMVRNLSSGYIRLRLGFEDEEESEPYVRPLLDDGPPE